MPNLKSPALARKYRNVDGPLGAMARGYLAGREGKDPSEASPEYEAAWLDGAADREFLANMGRAA